MVSYVFLSLYFPTESKRNVVESTCCRRSITQASILRFVFCICMPVQRRGEMTELVSRLRKLKSKWFDYEPPGKRFLNKLKLIKLTYITFYNKISPVGLHRGNEEFFASVGYQV